MTDPTEQQTPSAEPGAPDNHEETARREFLAKAARIVAGTLGGVAFMSLAKIDSVIGWGESAAQTLSTQKSIRRKVERTLTQNHEDKHAASEAAGRSGTSACACSCACSSCACTCVTCTCNCSCLCDCRCSCTEMAQATEQSGNSATSIFKSMDITGNPLGDRNSGSPSSGVHDSNLNANNVAQLNPLSTSEQTPVPAVSPLGLAAEVAALGLLGAWALLWKQAGEKGGEKPGEKPGES